MKKFDALVAQDIDQTLNTGLVKAHLTLYNSALNLEMNAAEINAADKKYPKVFDVPQIANFRANGGEERFQEVRAQVRESREVNMAFDAMPGAVSGVRLLYSTATGNVKYFTVRPHTIISLRDARDTAVEWLDQKGFPDPKETTICDNPKDKIAQVLQTVATLGLPAILVDDTMDGDTGLMVSSKSFSAKKLSNELTFVGFGMDTSEARSIAGKHGVSEQINILGLKSWQSSLVQGLIGELAR